MIFKTLNSTTIKNPNYRKLFNLSPRYSIIDNKLIVKRASSRQLNIMRATEKLSARSIATFVSGESSSEKDAINLLNALGCTVLASDGIMDPDITDFSYSLVDSQTDKTKMTNPNIIDTESLKKIKNEQIKGISSFPNEADPIYKLDGNIPRQIEVQNQESKNKPGSGIVISIASDLAKANLGTSSRSLKYLSDGWDTMLSGMLDQSVPYA